MAVCLKELIYVLIFLNYGSKARRSEWIRSHHCSSCCGWRQLITEDSFVRAAAPRHFTIHVTYTGQYMLQILELRISSTYVWIIHIFTYVIELLNCILDVQHILNQPLYIMSYKANNDCNSNKTKLRYKIFIGDYLGHRLTTLDIFGHVL